ncbi:uncharacterized protein LOC106668958 [Cimex lectularius]|uniref:Trypsin-like serine protease n=1 Tax=Cimex lectularius TaxID=79782 RepID=A0A8I6S126_CIMLE|nr:uncharacterized protein LOC106668958 [Cimex lectularius]
MNSNYLNSAMTFSNVNFLSMFIALYVMIFFSNAVDTNETCLVTIYEPLPGEIPSVISIMSRLYEQHQCIGVLITRWHTMTTCSCLTISSRGRMQSRLIWDDYILVAGITTLVNVKEKGQVRDVKVFIVHPGCAKDGNLIKYDIGFAVSVNPFDLGKYVHTAIIPFAKEGQNPPDFLSMLAPRGNYITASLVSWSKASNTKSQRMLVVRMAINSVQELRFNRVHTDNQKFHHFYTCLTFKTKFCPTFDEAAVLSDDNEILGVITGLKDHCNSKLACFTRIDSMLGWIEHVLSNGNVGKFNAPITLIILSLLYPLQSVL